MAYPPAPSFTKFNYAATVAAALAYLGLRQRDAVGLATFADGLGEVVPPRSSRQHFQAILEVLSRATPRGKTDLFAALAALAERAPRRGLFAILTDLWEAPERVVDALRALRGEKHEVILFHVLDAAEERFPFRAAAAFIDMETAEAVTVDGPDVRAGYVRALAERKRDFRLALGAHGVDYVPVVTDVPPSRVLVTYLGRRRALM